MLITSIWEGDYSAERKQLKGSLKTDVLIVGGGLTGILCAYRLNKAGVSCAVLEAGRLGGGVTLGTTAKLTAQHGLIYAGIMDGQGREAAQLYYRANQQALEAYRDLCKSIPCDFEQKNAYMYSRSDRRLLEKEAQAYQDLGIPFHMLEEPPLPFGTAGALGMEGQAQLHPLKFLHGIAEGLTVYENSPVLKLENGRAMTEHGGVTAERIILATHFPMKNISGLYFMKLYQSRSYVVALRDGPDINGVYLDTQPGGFSFRNHGEYLLLGGGGHKTGQRGAGYSALLELAAQAYPESAQTHAWSTQDCMTLDGLPYIGRHRAGSRNLFVAAGYNKWGMTGAMAAAAVLTDLLVKGSSEYEALFSPKRSIVKPQLLKNMASSISGIVHSGKRCTHIGCALRWNSAEESWDCPCHGSRFDKEGRVLDNPAQKPLRME